MAKGEGRTRAVNWRLAVAATSTSAATSLDLVQNKVGLKSYILETNHLSAFTSLVGDTDKSRKLAKLSKSQLVRRDWWADDSTMRQSLRLFSYLFQTSLQKRPSSKRLLALLPFLAIWCHPYLN